MSDQVRVLVIDDSAYNRRTIIKMLEAMTGVEVVAYACDGEEGLRKALDLKPDLITLDLEMPRMDGFTFLRIIMQNRPTPVIVVSARSDDQNVFKALEFGAVEFVAKPTARISPDLFNIREDLERKVRAIAGADMNKVLKQRRTAEPRARRIAPPTARPDRSGISQVVIGSSTGGPPALQTIFSAIRQRLEVGFAISQHMPPGFTRAFAERLNRFSALEVREAQDWRRHDPRDGSSSPPAAATCSSDGAGARCWSMSSNRPPGNAMCRRPMSCSSRRRRSTGRSCSGWC